MSQLIRAEKTQRYRKFPASIIGLDDISEFHSPVYSNERPKKYTISKERR